MSHNTAEKRIKSSEYECVCIPGLCFSHTTEENALVIEAIAEILREQNKT